MNENKMAERVLDSLGTEDFGTLGSIVCPNCGAQMVRRCEPVLESIGEPDEGLVEYVGFDCGCKLSVVVARSYKPEPIEACVFADEGFEERR